MIERLQEVYSLLSDEESKELYLNRLNYLVTKKEEYLFLMTKKVMQNIEKEREQRVKHFLETLPEDRKFVMYGAGGDAKRSLHYYEEDKRFCGFCDKSPEKQKSGFCGYTVISPEELVQKETISVVISTQKYFWDVRNFLLEKGIKKENIYDFTSCSFLCDPGQYFNPEFIHYEDEEVLLDVGSLNLGTAINMKNYCPKLKAVYAFEPDPNNFQKCVMAKDDLDIERVEIFPYGTWDKRTRLYFMAGEDSRSAISEQGSLYIETITIDEAMKRDPDEKVTFIKMDVEGAELESLIGAQETIKKDKPKLAISLYHKPEDMTEIPLYIKSLVPEYKLYIRHHSLNASETVLYAIPD